MSTIYYMTCQYMFYVCWNWNAYIFKPECSSIRYCSKFGAMFFSIPNRKSMLKSFPHTDASFDEMPISPKH